MSAHKLVMIGSAALALTLAGCGKKDEEAKVENAAQPEAAQPITTEAPLGEIPPPPDPAANLAKSNSWLEGIKATDGVKELESGLLFEVLKDSDGAQPVEGEVVTVHYTGSKMDGTVFDSSVARNQPVTFPLKNLIPGWKEGLLNMKQGQKAKFSMPPDLAYGELGTPDGTIGPNEAIQFEVELIEIISEEEAIKRAQAAYKERATTNLAKANEFLAKNKSESGIKTTSSGLQYEVIEKGAGSKPAASNVVKVNYRGTLLNGREFDSSYSRGKPAEFPLNAVIKGWTEGVQLMSPGAKYRFFVPPQLGYGEQGGGPIGPNELLIFEVELLEIKPAEPAASPAQ